MTLENVDFKFRNLTDLLFFSDRMDLDLSDYNNLLKSNKKIHTDYLYNNFKRATEIFYENGITFWKSRLKTIYSLNIKSLISEVDNHICKRAIHLFKTKQNINKIYDIELQQYLALCEIGIENGDNKNNYREYLFGVISFISHKKLPSLISNFIPLLFDDMNDFISYLTVKILQSEYSFFILSEFESQGIKFDKTPLVKLAKELLIRRGITVKNTRIFLLLLSDDEVMLKLKGSYKPANKKRLLNIIDNCDYNTLNVNFFANIKRLLNIDETIADVICDVYLDKLYARGSYPSRAIIDNIIKLLNNCPQIKPKKVLAYLSAHNRMSDIKLLIHTFPKLKKLSTFV
jgi:hypothetical protein